MKITPIRLYDYEGYMLEDFPSIAAASRALDIPVPNIHTAVSGSTLHSNGFQFRYIKAEVPEKLPSLWNAGNNKGREKVAVAKFWKDERICVYNSLTEAERKNFNISKGMISHSVEKGIPVNGFIFKEI